MVGPDHFRGRSQKYVSKHNKNLEQRRYHYHHDSLERRPRSERLSLPCRMHEDSGSKKPQTLTLNRSSELRAFKLWIKKSTLEWPRVCVRDWSSATAQRERRLRPSRNAATIRATVSELGHNSLNSAPSTANRSMLACRISPMLQCTNHIVLCERVSEESEVKYDFITRYNKRLSPAFVSKNRVI